MAYLFTLAIIGSLAVGIMGAFALAPLSLKNNIKNFLNNVDK